MTGPRSAGFATYCFAAGVLFIIAVLIIPLPPVCLDVFFALDLIFAVLVLVTSIVVGEAVEFTAFAPVLLIATLFRLALDVSATRLILSQGRDGGVGDLIPAFGEFVIRDNIVVGLIIFAILTTIQFVVIAAGAGRIAEVAARFTLDALPGKQMAIDAELHAGGIDAATAKARRKLVQREADFFGAMDGAGKFVKGDAIAALVIVVLNLIGGLCIGMGMHGMELDEALRVYACDSIGNALLTTLPSFLLSTAMGLLVTRVTADGSLGADIVAQLGRPRAIRTAAVFALVLACVPALPHLLFVIVGAGLFVLAAVAERSAKTVAAQNARMQEERGRQRLRRPEAALARIGVDPVTIFFGREVLTLCHGSGGEAVLDRIGQARRVIASEIGIILPGVRLRDSPDMAPHEYALAVRGERVARGTLNTAMLTAIGSDEQLAAIGGEPVHEPVYGLPARRIAPEQREAAERAGALVFDPVTLLISHLCECVRDNAARLLGRQELQTLCEHLRTAVPAVVKELQSERPGLTIVLRIMQALLEERVWPCDPVMVFEMMLDAYAAGMDERGTLAHLRLQLVPRQIRRAGIRRLAPLVVDPELEARVHECWQSGSVDATLMTALRDDILQYAQNAVRAEAAILCSAALRPEFARFVRRISRDVPVYAFSEIPNDIELRPAHIAGLRDLSESKLGAAAATTAAATTTAAAAAAATAATAATAGTAAAAGTAATASSAAGTAVARAAG